MKDKIQNIFANRELVLKICVVMVYVVGLVGFLTPTLRPLFEKLTPINLLFVMIILFYHHKSWSQGFLSVSIIIFAIGMLVEIVGVQTGLIFGEYEYGFVLGPKVWGVPLLIGINWLFLVYCIGTYFQNIDMNWMLKIVVSVFALILYDFFLETVAINTGMWNWSKPHPPLQNFIGWGVTSAVMFYLWYRKKFEFQNKFSSFLYFVQLLFFVILNVVGI